MFRDAILDIFSETWPMILICCVIVVSMRIVDLIKNKKDFILYKEILKLAFIVYIMCIFYVVTFQDVSWSTSNFTIFKEMFRYPLGSKLFFHNVIGNMLMFVPYGFFISYFLRIKNISLVFVMTLLTSITIELTQLAIGRVFDIDDIILNVIGSLVGFGIYYLLEKIKDRLPDILKKPIVYNIIMVAALIVVILYLFNIIRIGV